MNSNTKFQTIDVDPSSPREIVFRNPFPDKYEQLSTRKDLIKAWNEEQRIRQAELFEFYRTRRS